MFNMYENNTKEFFKISGQEKSMVGSNSLPSCLTIGTFKEIVFIYDSKLFSEIEIHLLRREEPDNILFIKLLDVLGKQL